MIVEIEKFNPYHDARGRFTNGSGAASFTIRTKDPKKQHLADKAMERERGRNTKLTPPTVAGVGRGKTMSHEEADDGKCNPNYYQSSYNGGYAKNCQSCVVAYEMRRRGYDVEAVIYEGKQNPRQKELAQLQTNGWRNEDGTPARFEGVNDRHEQAVRMNGERVAPNLTKKKAIAEINSMVGEGRYCIEYLNKGQQTSGHIVIAERIDGKVRVYDPQTNNYHTVEQIVDKMKLQTTRSGYYRGQKAVYNNHPLVMRMDNKVLKDDFADAVLQRNTAADD